MGTLSKGLYFEKTVVFFQKSSWYPKGLTKANGSGSSRHKDRCHLRRSELLFIASGFLFQLPFRYIHGLHTFIFFHIEF